MLGRLIAELMVKVVSKQEVERAQGHATVRASLSQLSSSVFAQKAAQIPSLCWFVKQHASLLLEQIHACRE